MGYNMSKSPDIGRSLSERPTSSKVHFVIFACLSALAASDMAIAKSKVLEEVVVTAQRREQSIQDVSMSITAFSEESLADRQIEGAEDIQFNLPNVVIARNTAVVRGVGNNAASSTAESGLGYHVNGIYIKFPALGASEYYDVGRIEVLRGPQGTLYGRNTTAGVINILTKKPQEELGGYISASAGNYGSKKIQGAINLPVTEKLRQRFSGLRVERDGYNKNVFTGNYVDGRDSFELRSSTAWDMTENLTMDFVVNYFKEDSNRATRTKGLCTKDADTGCSPVSLGFGTPDVTQSIFQILNAALWQGKFFAPGDYFTDDDNPDDYRIVNIDMEPVTTGEQLGGSLEFNYVNELFQYTSLTGFYTTKSDNTFDFDRFATKELLNNRNTGAPVDAEFTYRPDGKNYVTTRQIMSGRRDTLDAEQFTQEFRVSSNFEGSLNFLLGAFYYDNEQATEVYITHPTLEAAQIDLGFPDEFAAFYFDGTATTESVAVFGEGYWDITPSIRMTLGLRYTEDEKFSSGRLLFLNLTDPNFAPAEGEWSDTTGKVTTEWAINDDHMVYMTLAKGYKAGGLNPSTGSADEDAFNALLADAQTGGLDASSVTLAGATAFGDALTGSEPDAPRQFDAEYINSIEIGNKSSFFEGRMVANLSLFYYDYDGLQLGTVTPTLTSTINADAKNYGGEFEFAWAATDALVLEFQASYLKNEILNAVSIDEGDPEGEDPNTKRSGQGSDSEVVKDLSGNALAGAPEYSVKVAAAYTWTLLDRYSLMARVDHFFQDDYFVTQFNKETDRVDGWSQTDFQLVLTPNDGAWKARTYIKNIADSDDVTYLNQDGPLVGRFRTANVLEPQVYGMEFSYNF